MEENLECKVTIKTEEIEIDDNCLYPLEVNSKIVEIVREFRALINENTGKKEQESAASLLEQCNAIEGEMLSYVYKGELSKVELHKRQAFAAAAAVKACLLLRFREDSKLGALASLDLAMLLGVPVPGFDPLKMADKIHKELVDVMKFHEDKRLLLGSQRKNDCVPDFSIACSSDSGGEEGNLDRALIDDIPFEECPSVVKFHETYFMKEMPVKLLRCMDAWPALVKWKYVGYLKRLAGLRTVPVEVGDYTKDHEVRLITLSDYIDELKGKKPAADCGYMAQHQLMDQEPRLRSDIIVPDYCALTEDGNKTTYMWLGPPNAKSPLHFDRDHNFLAQVVGRKRIFLYSPMDTKLLYPRSDGLKNNSQIDFFKPDLKQFPKMTEAQPLVCTLNPGEMIFIPSGWWHAVVSLDISLSVNFFF